MQPDDIAYGGGAGASTIEPLVFVGLIVCIVLMLVVSRKWLAVPILSLLMLSSMGQQLFVGGVHLYTIHLIVLPGVIRVLMAKPESGNSRFAGGINSVDKAFTAWAVFHSLAVIVYYVVFLGDTSPIFFQASFAWDYIGAYFLFRYVIQNEEDVARVIRVFVVVTCICAPEMVYERMNGQNLFGSITGGLLVPEMRNGTYRAQGPFVHSLTAGVFGATMAPLCWWLWYRTRERMTALVGFISATTMVLTTGSSTPILSYATAFLGLALWPLRNRTRAILWGLLGLLILLHLTMQAPVWFLIARIEISSGSSGYHRAMIVDQCIRHFSDWWLVGTDQAGTWGFDMWDRADQYVAEAENGGLITFICFVLVLKWSFRRLRMARAIVANEPHKVWALWILGAALFSHATGFWGITYMDQTKIAWCAFLAILSAVTAPILASAAAEEPVAAVVSRFALVPQNATMNSRILRPRT